MGKKRTETINNEVMNVESEVNTDGEIIVAEEVAKERFFDRHPKIAKGAKIAGLVAGILAGGALVSKLSSDKGYIKGVNDAMTFAGGDELEESETDSSYDSENETTDVESEVEG